MRKLNCTSRSRLIFLHFLRSKQYSLRDTMFVVDYFRQSLLKHYRRWNFPTVLHRYENSSVWNSTIPTFGYPNICTSVPRISSSVLHYAFTHEVFQRSMDSSATKSPIRNFVAEDFINSEQRVSITYLYLKYSGTNNQSNEVNG